MSQYIFSNEAENDLIEIYRYGFINYGEIKADQYMDILKEKCQFLADTPFLCSNRDEFKLSVRIYHHKKHLIVYIVEKGCILIVRILHERMDVSHHLEK